MSFLEEMSKTRYVAVKEFCENIARVEILARLEKAREAQPVLLALAERDDVAVIAEFKKASPSVGPIAPDADPATQAAAYERGGAFMVSCLCEPSAFDGSFEDMHEMSRAIKIPILAKDFVVAPEQLPIFRACGADAALLIVGIDGKRIPQFVEFCPRTGLVPLVEVHDDTELSVAIDAGAPFIAVNARDLNSLEVDNDAVLPLIKRAKQSGALVVAASGIKTRQDVERAAAAGADAVLVGESLMRAADPEAAVRALTGVPRVRPPRRTSIKVCGITTPEDAVAVAELGADSIGVIFTESSRKVDCETGKKIFSAVPRRIRRVGVFANDTRATVATASQFCKLDALQLHGDEDIDFCKLFDKPIIKGINVKDLLPLEKMNSYGEPVVSFLLDTLVDDGPLGGTGKVIDWEAIGKLPNEGVFILSGGLTPENVGEAIRIMHPDAVDVCSGVESAPGVKDLERVKAFIDAVRAADKEVYGE